jgi:hypothetical protein
MKYLFIFMFLGMLNAQEKYSLKITDLIPDYKINNDNQQLFDDLMGIVHSNNDYIFIVWHVPGYSKLIIIDKAERKVLIKLLDSDFIVRYNYILSGEKYLVVLSEKYKYYLDIEKDIIRNENPISYYGKPHVNISDSYNEGRFDGWSISSSIASTYIYAPKKIVPTINYDTLAIELKQEPIKIAYDLFIGMREIFFNINDLYAIFLTQTHLNIIEFKNSELSECQKLRLKRNQYYAYYGREFKTEFIHNYFMKNYRWYKYKKKKNDVLLNEYEIEEVKIFLHMEKGKCIEK